MNKYTLLLENFGKFDSRNYALNDVSIFYGPNEVGKTTVIDGVIHALNKKPAGNLKDSIKKDILLPRYGENFSSKLKINSNNEEVARVNQDLILDLLLVRASDITLSMQGSWIGSVRNKLFVGGVNPKTVIEKITAMEEKKTKASKSPLFDVKKTINPAISEAENSLNTVKASIASHAQTILQQEKLKAEEERLAQLLQEQNTEYNSKKSMLDNQNSLEERENITLLNKHFFQLKEKQGLLDNTSNYSAEALSNVRLHESDIAELKRQVASHATSASEKEHALSLLEEQLELKQASVEPLKKHHDLALTTQTRLDIQISDNVEQKASKPTGLIIIGCICLIVGIALLAVLDGMVKAAGIVAAIIGVGFFLKAFLGKNTIASSNLDLRTEISTFNHQYAGNPPCPDSDYKSAKDFLSRLVAEYVQANNDVNSLMQQKKTLQLGIRENQKHKHTQQTLLDIKEDELKALLPNGILDGDRYFQALENNKAIESQVTDLLEDLEDKCQSYDCKHIEDLKIYISNQMHKFDEQPIEGSLLTAQAMNTLRIEVDAIQAAINKTRQSLNNASKELATTNLEIELQIGSLSKQQLKIEKKLYNLKEERNKKQIEMDALILLRDIVQEIDDDAGQQFQLLSEGINAYLQLILGEQREITFESLDVEHIKCHDHYKNEVAVNQLSSGTKDAFALAARLALLEKIYSDEDDKPAGDAFLILDDPFVFMDKQRRQQAITAVKKFHHKVKLPIIFLSKDEQTKDEFCANFPDALLHELTRE